MIAFTFSVLAILAIPILVSSDCSYNRLDQYPCIPRPWVSVPRPKINEFGVYSTRIRGNGNVISCILRKRGHIIQNIENITTPDVKLLYSPGFERHPQQNYVNQMFAEYNIACSSGQSAYLSINSLEMEPANCQNKCQDYIQIIVANGGVTEICGSQSHDDIFVGTGKFHLKLRTSEKNTFQGFSATVICFNQQSQSESKNRPSAGWPAEPPCSSVNPADLNVRHSKLQMISQQSYAGMIRGLKRKDRVELRSLADPTSTLTLTRAEKEILDTLIAPLVSSGLNEAQKHAPKIWPPPEFEDDIEDPIPGPPIIPNRELTYQQPLTDPNPERNQPFQRFQKRSTLLATEVNRVAVAYQDSCNLVLKAVTNSIIETVRRLAPNQLSVVEDRFHQDQNDLSLST